MNIIKNQNILCIFNSQRYFQGLLLNYVHQKNHACFQGKISSVKYHKYDQKIIQIYLPFLYMLSLIKDRDIEWNNMFDLILQHILQIIMRENYQINSILLLLYFLQINEYRISQSTLACLYQHLKQHQNFYLNIVIKYLDVHKLIQNGLKIDQLYQPFQDPVQKTILMFYLQNLWKQKWNLFQGFQGWWSPSFFNSQNDRQFNQSDYFYSQKRQNRVQWSVMNLVSKDYCKCFIEPIFIVPEYSKLNRYRQQYNKKECYNERLKQDLNKKIINNKIIFNKQLQNKFDKIKFKLLNINQQIKQYYKDNNKSNQEYQTQCLYIDILSVIQGYIKIYQGFIIFSSSHKTNRFDHMCIKAFKNQQYYYMSILINDISQIYKKRFNSSNNGIYIKTKDGKQMLFYFYHKNIDIFLSYLPNTISIKTDPLINYMNSNQPLLWIDKSISNYQYLQWLNEIAGRNYNDITQYPVLPWVYICNTKDDNKSYRNLSKNMGCNGDQQRIQHFIQKYKQDNQQQLFNQYHFGTHYSSSAIIFNYLIRIRPYSIGAITLQSGKFDCADRIFYSYCGSWKNAISSPTDIRQLIPQIYTLPQMFLNKNNYEYGLTQDKIIVDNVLLPDWCNQNPYIFVSKIRKQLQSIYVSQNIHEWIDLIYGYKQRGIQAQNSINIFYPLTYQRCIDLDKVTDLDQRMSFQTQIAHFGQNPSQIIGNNPHPNRRKQKLYWQQKLISDGGELLIQKCFLNKAPNKQQKYLFKSIFEGKNTILSIKFINQQLFIVLRKYQYHIYKIINKKNNFLSRQQTISYNLQSCTCTFNYKELSIFIPVTIILDQIIIIGGFYNGYIQIIFIKQSKYNRSFKFPVNTITAINYQHKFHLLFIADQQGYLRSYKINNLSKSIEFECLKNIKAHDSKINDITINPKANIICTCSIDGSLNIYNLYSQSIIRKIYHPLRLPIYFAQISTSPLYSVVFYSKDNNIIYIYSINGQFLDTITDKTGFIYNIRILRSTDSTQCLVYLNAQRQLYIYEMPFPKLRRKVKVRKDEFRVSCFQACYNGKIAINGTQDGAFQMIANPSAY